MCLSTRCTVQWKDPYSSPWPYPLAICTSDKPFTLQKGFLHTLNWVAEHIHVLNVILSHAHELWFPLSITFFDLKNTFWSLTHSLITDIFQLVGILKKISQTTFSCTATVMWQCTSKSMPGPPHPSLSRKESSRVIHYHQWFFSWLSHPSSI